MIPPGRPPPLVPVGEAAAARPREARRPGSRSSPLRFLNGRRLSGCRPPVRTHPPRSPHRQKAIVGVARARGSSAAAGLLLLQP